jgi:hypothetical protein
VSLASADDDDDAESVCPVAEANSEKASESILRSPPVVVKPVCAELSA